MTILRVEAWPLEASFQRQFGGVDRVPPALLRPASHFEVFPRSGQFSTVVKIVTDDGIEGYGEAFGLPHAAVSATFIQEVIAPALTGRTVGTVEATIADLRRFLAALGHSVGVAAEAMSAIDIALWDVGAKRKGVPLHVELGASDAPLAVYASPVPLLPTTAETASAAEALVEEGFRAIKLKIGRSVEIDRLHVQAARSAIGPDVALMLDANCFYGVEAAIELACALADYEPAWLEEPVAVHDLAGLQRVAAASSIPLAAGENLFDVHDFRRLAECGAVRYLQPNITRAGGVSGVLAVDRICAEHGLGLALHGVGGGICVAASLATAVACRTACYLEANRLPNPLRDDLPTHKAMLRDGMMIPCGRPGHGGDPALEQLRSYRWQASTGQVQ